MQNNNHEQSCTGHRADRLPMHDHGSGTEGKKDWLSYKKIYNYM